MAAGQSGESRGPSAPQLHVASRPTRTRAGRLTARAGSHRTEPPAASFTRSPGCVGVSPIPTDFQKRQLRESDKSTQVLQLEEIPKGDTVWHLRFTREDEAQKGSGCRPGHTAGWGQSCECPSFGGTQPSRGHLGPLGFLLHGVDLQFVTSLFILQLRRAER